MGSTKDTVKTDQTGSGNTSSTGATGGATPKTGTVAAKTGTKNNASVYTARELAENAKALFNTMPECVTAALRFAGVTVCTIEEAKIIVKNFLNQEVD